MKKEKHLIYVMLLTIFGLTGVGCSEDDPIDPIDPTDPEENVLDPEDLRGEVTEDVTLDPSETYQLTEVLSVTSGATLTIPAGTHIVANTDNDESSETNVYIEVQQGGMIDIQGTASAPVVMSAASSEAGSWGGLLIAGNAKTTAGVDVQAEVGGIIYGGTDPADNSGTIKHLIISDAGAQIDPESQFNGLSFYAVGSGTTIENVAILNGADDGVEFFGGSVSVDNVYLENNQDDAVDWTEGWDGSIEDVYVLHSIGNFSTAIEADGANGNPVISNFTAVSTIGGTAIQFKAQSGATISGLSLSGYDTAVEIAEAERIDLSGIQLNGAVADLEMDYTEAQTVDASMFDWVSSRGQVAVLPGTIDSDLTLDANSEYLINNRVSVREGTTLTIPAGTRITARSSDSNEDGETVAPTEIYIVVEQGSMIDIQGTEDNPVIMSSTSGEPGSWGGLILAGNAQTTAGVDATAEVGGIIYGGTNPEDNSGSIAYLVISDAGAQIDPESQYNGLSLYAVGSGTTINNVALMNGADDGVEFFGGSVSATNLYLENNEDDAVDWTEGWNGALEDVYVYHNIGNFSTAIEADGVNNNPVITNFTAVSETGGTALQFKAQSGATFTGFSLAGYDTYVEIAEVGRTDLSSIQIDGADADLEAAYDTEASVDSDTFLWAQQ